MPPFLETKRPTARIGFMSLPGFSGRGKYAVRFRSTQVHLPGFRTTMLRAHFRTGTFFAQFDAHRCRSWRKVD